MNHWTDAVLDEARSKAGPNRVMQKAIAEIAKMTDWNDHSGAVVALAKIVRDKKLQKAAEAIVTLHEFFGHMPSELIQVRTHLMNQGLKRAEKMYPDFADQIHSAF